MTLMCGPIDPRINETEISRLTRQRDINWFQKNMIARVPEKYPGRGRDVFPGFLQALGAVAAAQGQKQQTTFEMLRKVYGEQGEKLDAHAPYYLDTIEQVFLEHKLPRGTMTWRNEKIDPAKIRDTALFTIEGTHDNITAPGQTLIAHKLCKHIPSDLKHHRLQSGAGHYDLFSGTHWKHEISNEIKDFFRKIAATRGIAYDPPQVDTSVAIFQKLPVKQYLVA
jgi:poly(3-hydroxybutyrate) depolymerase